MSFSGSSFGLTREGAQAIRKAIKAIALTLSVKNIADLLFSVRTLSALSLPLSIDALIDAIRLRDAIHCMKIICVLRACYNIVVAARKRKQNDLLFIAACIGVALTFIAFVFSAQSAERNPMRAVAAATMAGETVQSISIATSSSLDHLVEGDTVQFTAILSMSDGTTRDGTSDVEWRALGYAGSIDQDGTFTAHLEKDVSELGRAPGVVVAIYKAATAPTILIGASPIFYTAIQEDNADLPG